MGVKKVNRKFLLVSLVILIIVLLYSVVILVTYVSCNYKQSLHKESSYCQFSIIKGYEYYEKLNPPMKIVEIERGTSVISAPSEVIEKADQYIISLIGENYFEDKFTLKESFSYPLSEKDRSSYSVIYDYLLGKVIVRLDLDKNIVKYQGPTKPYSFSISKEEAIRIAKSNGLQEPITAELVYGGKGYESDTGTITESYMWNVWSDKHSKGDPEIVYIDIDTGNILGVKTYLEVPIREY